MEYLHIPKTAGTAFKNCEKDKIVMPFKTLQSHGVTLLSHRGDTAFGLRDPWERFASGYWERVTNPLREELNARKEYNFYRRGGYRNLQHIEEQLFEQYNTPNALITGLRTGVATELFDRCVALSPDFSILTRSLSFWLGELHTYLEHEHKVSVVYDVSKLDAIFLKHHNIQLPTDSFLRRSRSQFDREQTYAISKSNLKWFKQWRKADYELIEHIVAQSYYVTDDTHD